MSSVSGKRGGGVFGGAHYSAAKAGILGFAKALAREVAADGITVNSIAPGLVLTDIRGGIESEAEQARMAANIPSSGSAMRTRSPPSSASWRPRRRATSLTKTSTSTAARTWIEPHHANSRIWSGPMQALVKTEPIPGATLLEIEPPRIGRDEVKVEVKAGAICGTDIPRNLRANARAASGSRCGDIWRRPIP